MTIDDPGANSNVSESAALPDDLLPRLTLEEALAFIVRVRTRFGNNSNAYTNFLEALSEFRRDHALRDMIRDRVREILRDHSDLVEEFNKCMERWN